MIPWIVLIAVLVPFAAYLYAPVSGPELHAAEPGANLDPAAWGEDHVGQSLPEYMTGDECLFCHRDTLGPAWQQNRHYLMLRLPADDPPAMAALKQNKETAELADAVGFVLGDKRQAKFLKKSEGYGKFDVLSVGCTPHADKKTCDLGAVENPHWDAEKFANRCAGCHATAVDSEQKTFASPGLDCYVCHGEVIPDHANDTRLVHLSKARKDPARVAIAICAQCHVRTGKSKSSGLPYPNNFVAGDNLFRDFEIDFSDEAIAKLNPADRHVVENVRDVVVRGDEHVTCMTCHDVHGESTKKHERVSRSRHLCVHCHEETGPKSKIKEYAVHSETCEY